MKTLICAPIKVETEQVLNQHGYKVLQMPASKILPDGLKYHADLQVLKINKHLFVNEELLPYVDSDLQKQTFVQIGETYPKDCALNIKIVGKYAIFNDKCIDSTVYEFLHNNDYHEIIVKQGYAGCSICKINDTAIITADASIAKAMSDTGIDVLKIKSGHILLPCYETGFICGCNSNDDQNVYFNGNVYDHPDADQICSFISKHQKQIICLNNGPLTDIGGFVIIND